MAKIKFSTVANNRAFVRPSGYSYPLGLSQTVAAQTGVSAIDYLVVAGGGASGSSWGAGGGAGGFLTSSGTSVSSHF